MSGGHEFDYFLNGHSPGDGLVKLCIEDIAKSGLSPENLESAEVRIFSGSKDQLKERLGFASINGQDILQLCRLIEFPGTDESGNTSSYSYKIVPSLKDKEGRDVKYLHPIGKPALPYIHPAVWEVKDKPNKPVWITEGAKKALKLIQHGRHAIALSGIWNFKAGKNSSEIKSDKNLWAELEAFQWRGRTVYMGFDGDLWTNHRVREALYELAIILYERKAIVRIAQW